MQLGQHTGDVVNHPMEGPWGKSELALDLPEPVFGPRAPSPAIYYLVWPATLRLHRVGWSTTLSVFAEDIWIVSKLVNCGILDYP